MTSQRAVRSSARQRWPKRSLGLIDGLNGLVDLGFEQLVGERARPVLWIPAWSNF